MPSRPPEPVTFSNILANRHGLNAYCQTPGCGYRRRLAPADVDMLANEVGHGTLIYSKDVMRRLSCKRCGKRSGVQWRLSIDRGSSMGMERQPASGDVHEPF